MLEIQDYNSPETHRGWLREVCLKNTEDFMDNLERYDNLSCKKHLVYYEDLITDPERTILRIIDFLGDGQNSDMSTRFRDFVKNYETHRNKSLNLTIAAHDTRARPHTKGEKTKLVYYSAATAASLPGHNEAPATIFNPQELAAMLDLKAQRCKNNLYMKYLSRYKEQR